MARPIHLADILEPQNNSFGVLRLAMAGAVLVSHSYFFVTGETSAEPLYRWTGHTLGEHAVQVFFFLSGIMVTESLARSRGAIDFATARVLRIFPGLIVCVLLTALVIFLSLRFHEEKVREAHRQSLNSSIEIAHRLADAQKGAGDSGGGRCHAEGRDRRHRRPCRLLRP